MHPFRHLGRASVLCLVLMGLLAPSAAHARR